MTGDKKSKMTRERILNFERERDGNNLKKFYLFNDEPSYYGGDFYHAYEWSAYLCTHLQSEKIEKILNPYRSVTDGSGEEVVMAGLKMSNFDGFFGFLKKEGTVVVHDKYIEVDAGEFLKDDDVSLDTYKNTLDEWRKTLRRIDQRERKGKKKESAMKKNEVFVKLKKAQIALMTPIDAISFLCEIQKALFELE